MQAQPDYGLAVCILALIDAGLGRKEQALQEAQRAVQLVPVEKDALNGVDMILYSGVVAAWVGEKDLAIQNISKAAQLPGVRHLWRSEATAMVRPIARRSALRANRGLIRAKGAVTHVCLVIARR